MRIKRVEIKGYRSIKGNVELHVEPNVTVVLGANDHGKTNILRALLHFNEKTPFDKETDLSWDLETDHANFPQLVVDVDLDEDERKQIFDQETNIRAKKQPPSPANPEPVIPVDASASLKPDLPATLAVTDVPSGVRYIRRGVGNEIAWEGFDGFDRDAVQAVLQSSRPRIELIDPQSKLSDGVTAAELQQSASEFMRGIFHYAGIDPKTATGLFTQSDATEMVLANASQKLNNTLRASWSQGTDLQFHLSHNSAASAIELKIADPSVESRYVRVSRRSSGFTHYFALKTILYSREKENPAKSYLWLFDEPGIYLHPSGQYDLIQVLETLGKINQVIYVTHSLFMINKTFPTRHRLVLKTVEGTCLEPKPYVSRWGSAMNSLGLSTTGTIFFADHVLLTEGDTEPILLPAVIQRLVATGELSFDLNPVSFVATGESKNADAQIRMLVDARPSPKLGLLFDGDPGGLERREDLMPLIKLHGIPDLTLDEKHSIEDYLPLVSTVFVDAVARYVAKLMVTKGKSAPDLAKLKAEFRESFRKRYKSEETPREVSHWADEEAKRVAELKNAPSKVGIAREYIALLEDVSDEEFRRADKKRVLGLIGWIQKNLGVPELRDVAEEILASPNSVQASP